MRCYRITKPAFAASALSGEGARLYGGRWSPPGWRCVYTADSRALTVLEMMVHLSGQSRSLHFKLLTIDIDDSLVTEAKTLPSGWKTHPAGNSSQTIGRAWLKAAKKPALRVPSVIIPEETNLLLNPAAPGFERIRVIEDQDFRLDPRLAADPS